MCDTLQYLYNKVLFSKYKETLYIVKYNPYNNIIYLYIHFGYLGNGSIDLGKYLYLDRFLLFGFTYIVVLFVN